MYPSLNTYAYVNSSPLYWVDPFGLSAEDVERIQEMAKQTIEKMTKRGNRSDSDFGKYWKNSQANVRDWACIYLGVCEGASTTTDPNKPMRCFEQTNEVIMDWEVIDNFDDTWVYVHATTENGSHTWAEAYSSNPSDPVVIVDPWNGTIAP